VAKEIDVAHSIKGEEIESVLRSLLLKEGYRLNERRQLGETGVDIRAEREGRLVAIECIGFQEHPPTRSREFYEVFFRAISRLGEKVEKSIIALPAQFGRGLDSRARQHGTGWKRIGEAFPELEIWLIDTQKGTCLKHPWAYWPAI
jgi:hypothetical protein